MEAARMLGKALSESDEFLQMMDAQRSLSQDSAASAMLSEYQRKQKIMLDLLPHDNLERDQISALSADIERIQSILLDNSAFTRLIETQAAFQKLVRQVNKVISSSIGMETEAGAEQCRRSSACDSCVGCKH